MRPRRWASWRRDPAWLEIWMSTLASGMSMELSPTFDRNTVLICSNHTHTGYRQRCKARRNENAQVMVAGFGTHQPRFDPGIWNAVFRCRFHSWQGKIMFPVPG